MAGRPGRVEAGSGGGALDDAGDGAVAQAARGDVAVAVDGAEARAAGKTLLGLVWAQAAIQAGVGAVFLSLGEEAAPLAPGMKQP